jgi:hypothetical protein
LQYSPNIIRITKWRLRNLFLWEGLCVTGWAAPEVWKDCSKRPIPLMMKEIRSLETSWIAYPSESFISQNNRSLEYTTVSHSDSQIKEDGKRCASNTYRRKCIQSFGEKTLRKETTWKTRS